MSIKATLQAWPKICIAATFHASAKHSTLTRSAESGMVARSQYKNKVNCSASTLTRQDTQGTSCQLSKGLTVTKKKCLCLTGVLQPHFVNPYIIFYRYFHYFCSELAKCITSSPYERVN